MMSSVASSKSTFADNDEAGGAGQASKAQAFGARVKERAAAIGKKPAEIAREAHITPQLVSEYSNGKKIVGTTKLFALADVLRCSPRWLATGEGPVIPRIGLADAADSDWVMIPRYELVAFSFDDGRPDPVEEVPIRRDWLYRFARQSKDLWMAEMPGDAMPEIAAAGEYILCRDPTPPLADGRVYAWLIDNRPLVRRVQVTPAGLILKASDPTIEPINISAEELENGLDGIAPIALVLGALALKPA